MKVPILATSRENEERLLIIVRNPAHANLGAFGSIPGVESFHFNGELVWVYTE